MTKKLKEKIIKSKLPMEYFDKIELLTYIQEIEQLEDFFKPFVVNLLN